MSLRQLGGLGALMAAIGLSGGCSSLEIKYQPTTPAGMPTKANVTLKVADIRPLDKGRDTGTRVGSVRGGFGNSIAVEDKHADVAPHTIGDATSDALLRVGVGVNNAGQKTLVASIKEYWMDGYMGYKASIIVAYQLMDAAGKPMWSSEVTGVSGGTNMFKSGNTLAKDLFSKALADLVNHASEQFNSPGFQQALAM
jgi:hypothetical protein